MLLLPELDSSGSNLVYSTYLGGNAVDEGAGIAVDSMGNAYVTGFTYSSNFPAISGITYSSNSTNYTLPNKQACNNTIYFNANAFIAKISPGGTNLVCSTYFGGTNFDQGNSIAVDNNGFVYVTGSTASTNFPTLNAIVQDTVWTNLANTNLVVITNLLNGYGLNSSTNRPSCSDAFVAKFDATGTNLVMLYSTLLGGTNSDVATHIAVDTNGAAYVTGWTVSTNFPNTVGTSIGGLHSFVATNISFGLLATNVFLTKITNAIGSTNVGIAWSAVFGGQGADIGYGVALDPAGNDVFVTGSASSTNFPVYNVPGLMSATNSSTSKTGKSDVFVIAFTNDASAMLYSGYLGGKDNDYGYGIAVDANDNAYVVGQTLSTNFPSFNGPFTTRNGTNDAFLTQILMNPEPPTITTDLPDQIVSVGSSVTFSVSGGVNGPGPYFYQWQKDDVNLANGTNLLSGANVITSGATNDTLVISNVQTNNSGFYQVVVTNYGGTVTSIGGSLTVTNIPPAIEVPPASQTNGAGTTVTMTVIATGSAPLSYQWQFNGTNLMNGTNLVNGAKIITTGASSNILTIRNVQLTNSGTYTIVVTNTIYGGSATTNASLSVQTTLSFQIQPTPTNQTLAVGDTAALGVLAVGPGPLHYQWKLNGTNVANVAGHIIGATTNLLFIGNVQTTNAGNYTVVVTNITGAITSAPAVLNVTNIPPFITVQPVSQLVAVGSNVTLTVTAGGTAPLKYQWWFNTTNLLSGATNNVLKINNAQTNNSGSYTVVVTNLSPFAATSSPAILTVQGSPFIKTQPVGQTIAVSSNVTFNVIADGLKPLHYQWQMNGTNLVNETNLVNGVKVIIRNATSTNLTILNAQTNNSGSYTVVVMNIAGSVTSSNAILNVTNITPVITKQPTNQTVVAGTNIKMIIAARGSPPLSYQWQVGGLNLVDGTNLINGIKVVTKGSTTTNLSISSAQTNNSGTYAVIVSNPGASTTSSNATLTVAGAPLILTQPANQVVLAGANVTNVVRAIGTTPLHYQWRMNGTNLANGTNLVNGAKVITRNVTSTNLIILNAQTNNSGTYSVIITNIAGSAISTDAVLTVVGAPVIVTQPTDQSAGVGLAATFTVTASGVAPLHYQWQVGGINLVDGPSGDGSQVSGSTTTNLTISNLQTNENGNSYSVTVMNAFGSATSSNALLTVTNVAPAIVGQPQDQTLRAGSNATFTVTASGTAPLSYQWQVNGTNLTDVINGDGSQISGSTTASLTVSNAQTNEDGNYTVIVTNLAGSVTSSVAVLTVAQLPEINNQPTNQTAGPGSNATFGVGATGTEPLFYQWYKDATNILVNGGHIKGANTSQLTIKDVQTNDDNSVYSVTITNLAGSVTSSNAVLTVALSPIIVQQPTNLIVGVGSTATFTVNAIGITPLSYQWQLDGTNLVDGTNPDDGSVISGSTTPVLAISNAQTNNSSTNYAVIVSNSLGSTNSSSASLIVTAFPLILEQPADQIIAIGSTATFTVNAVGLAPLSYQWYFNGTNLLDVTNVDGSQISGSTNATLAVSLAQTNEDGNYTVIVSNSVGSVTSSNAALTVVRLMVVAWGDNEYGQTNVPVASTNAMAIACGGFHNLVLQTNGTVVAWGAGQTNDPSDGSDYGQAIVPAGLTNVVAIAGGGYHSLALQANGMVMAWGAGTNNNGSFPTNGQSIVPAGLTNVVAIAGAYAHSLALTANGTVIAWGDNTYGQTDVPLDLTNAVAIACGGYHSLALTASGTVVAWGYNANGQTNVPPDLTNVVAIAGGGYHSLALTANGTVVAWGDNTYGQTNVPPDLTNVVAIAGGGFHSLALTANGTVVAWGAGQINDPSDESDDYGQSMVPAGLTNVVAVAAGYLHSLILENDGSPYIVMQPASQTALTNTTATFTVTALGAPTLSYQWQKDGTNLVDGGNVSGSTNATLTLTDVQAADAAGYTVVITNAIGSVTSSNANLTVTEVAPAFVLEPVVGKTPWSPVIRSIRITADGNITIAGDSGGDGNGALAGRAGGTNAGYYYVLASSNLLAPLTNWTLIATNQFDSDGNFIFTNAAPTNSPQYFYLIQLP